MPVYLVKTPNGELMVSAPTKAGAVNHVIKKTITAEALTADAVVARMDEGESVVKVETASKPEPAQEEAGQPEAEPEGEEEQQEAA